MSSCNIWIYIFMWLYMNTYTYSYPYSAHSIFPIINNWEGKIWTTDYSDFPVLMNAPIWKEKERERVVVIWKMRICVSTHAAGGESGLEKNGKCRFHNRFYGEREQKWTELSILYINSLNNQGHDGWKQTKQEYKFNCFSQFFKLSFNSVRANEICISGSMKDT